MKEQFSFASLIIEISCLAVVIGAGYLLHLNQLNNLNAQHQQQLNALKQEHEKELDAQLDDNEKQCNAYIEGILESKKSK
jgi:hypothetical protein